MEKEKNNCKIINENHMENCNVFQGDIFGATFPLPGSQVTINQTFGKGAKPTTDVAVGKVETAEEREKRKQDVMKSIVDLFCFDNSQLGYDHNRKKITNERLALLFKKCFGLSGYPTTKNRQIMEQLWVMLMDARNQCNKEPGEGFFRQTVLNVLGYFRQNEILFGGKNDLLQTLFPKANTNLAKNIERGITSTFPEGTDEMLDYYIDQMMEGAF